MGLCSSTPVQYQEDSSTTNTRNPASKHSDDTTSSSFINDLKNKKEQAMMLPASSRQNLKAALIPHVKLHRNQNISDLYDLSNEKLGEGMTGAVIRATVKGSGQEVAIKNVRKKLVRDVQALLKEISLLAQCDHPNIVRIVGSAEDKHNVYMALEVCTGGALLDCLMNSEAHHFEEDQVGRMAVMMFRAIEYCHSHGIAHRDLKLDNWLFEKENGELKLIDFGLSKKFYSGSYNHHGQHRMTSFLGTPGFVAPEMQQTHLGERSSYTFKVDVWSLGIIVFALLSGKMPFKRRPTDCVPLEDKEGRVYRRSFSKSPWTNNISHSCIDFVESLLDPNPETRPSAQEALEHPFLIKHAAGLQEKRLHTTLSGKTLLNQEKTALRRMTEFAKMDALQKGAMLLIGKYFLLL
jgi:serine/threonine protein kinase